MKKTLTLFLFSLFCTLSFAEIDSNQVEENSVDTAAVYAFFESKNITIDSCANEQLYIEVYNWIGTPYRYAGKTKKGIDCSGFSSKVYEGVYGSCLNGGSRIIFKKTEPVKLLNAQEGDLVFFKIRKNQISHIGIYLQNGKFAHASSSRGVVISDLSQKYYKRYFFKVGRINAITGGF